MALLEIKKDLTTRELRVFAGALFPAFCAILGWLLLRWTDLGLLSLAVWGLGGAVLVLGLAAPRLVRPIYLGWMYAAYPVGWTVSHIVILVVYYLVLTPVGVAARLAGYDPMARKFERERDSYWIPRAGPGDKGRYFRQF